MTEIPKFKIIDPDDIPKTNKGHKSTYATMLPKILEKIPPNKAMEIPDPPAKGIYNYISQQQRHKHYTNIIATRRTIIIDPTTKPPTKELKLYIIKHKPTPEKQNNT